MARRYKASTVDLDLYFARSQHRPIALGTGCTHCWGHGESGAAARSVASTAASLLVATNYEVEPDQRAVHCQQQDDLVGPSAPKRNRLPTVDSNLVPGAALATPLHSCPGSVASGLHVTSQVEISVPAWEARHWSGAARLVQWHECRTNKVIDRRITVISP